MVKTISRGFTIVELLIVVVVIAILAAITVVAYNGITAQAKDAAIKSELSAAAKQLHLVKVGEGSFPEDGPVDTMTTTFSYERTSAGFCLEAAGNNKVFYVTESGVLAEGECPLDAAMLMQTVTTASCPVERTMKVDARDNHTYWIQKMPDGKCWMLTNLAYAGGGTDTYGDVKVIQNGTGDTSTTYTEAKYYIHSASNPTTYPEQPSTHTAGGSGASRQYGYYYNWCAAMGAQINTGYCGVIGVPSSVDSICPSNWRLPTGASSGEFLALVDSIGATNDAAGANNLQSNWLAQRSGYRYLNFVSINFEGRYWSSTATGSTSAYIMMYSASTVNPSANYGRDIGHSVRCVAST